MSQDVKTRNTESFNLENEIFTKELKWTPLHYMVERGETRKIENVLKQATAINAKDSFGRTPLSLAAATGNLSLVELLLRAGSTVNEGWSLHYACEKGHTLIVECLIENGASVNLGRDSNYPLLIACIKGNLRISEMLIEHGADINVVDKDKETAVHLACDSGNAKLISFLLNTGCNPNIQDKFNLTPLAICLIRKENRPDLVKLLLSKGASLNMSDDEGYTYLHHAEHPESTLEIIKNGGELNAQNVYKETPLYNATYYQNFACARILLHNNADPNIATNKGLTPLHCAAAHGSLECVKELLHKGAKINAASAENIIPLHLATLAGHLEVAKVLVERGSFVDIPIIDGCGVSSSYFNFIDSECFIDGATPLSIAASKSHTEICKLLISCGANCKGVTLPQEVVLTTSVKKTNDWPCSKILDLVISNSLEKLEKLHDGFKEVDSLGWTLLHHAVAKGFHELSYVLIKKGLSVNAQDKYWRTPLSIAAARNDLKILVLLLDNGANVNLGLPLHHAIDSEAIECIAELVKHGCDLDIKDDTEPQNTALIKAATDTKTEIVKILLEHKANPNCRNKWGETPLHQSCRFGDYEAVKFLLESGADVNAVDTCNDTPLLNATLSGNVNVVKLLIHNNANVNNHDKFKRTPLHNAASSNFEDAVTELINAGALVDAPDDEGETSLFAGAENKIIVKTLIQSNADVNHRLPGGWTPLHESAESGNLNCVKALLQNNANVNGASAEFVLPIYLASIRGYVAIVKKLIDHGSYVNSYILDIGVIRDDSGVHPLSERYHIVAGNTPLIGAAAKGHLEVVQLLCMHGAILNVVNCEGNSALHEAVLGGFESVVEFLLTLNVNLKIRNRSQKTPLEIAEEKENTKLIQLLSEKM